MKKISVVLASGLVYVLKKFKFAYTSRGFTLVDSLFYALLVRYNLDYKFFKGYKVGELMDSEFVKEVKSTKKLLNEFLLNLKIVPPELQEIIAKTDSTEVALSLFFGSGTTGNSLSSCVNFFRGFLYFSSCAYRLNYLYVANISRDVSLPEGELSVVYETILRSLNQKVGVLITLPEIDEFKCIVTHRELFLTHGEENNLGVLTSIDVEQIQRLGSMLEKCRDVFDNDSFLFLRSLKLYCENNVHAPVKFFADLNGTEQSFAIVFLCLLTDKDEFIRIPVYF